MIDTTNKTAETIPDIVREMRKDIFSTRVIYAERIEAAYARLPLLTPEQWTAFARQGAELAELRKEVARLREALGQEEAR